MRKFSVLFALVALVLAGCGDDGSTVSGSGSGVAEEAPVALEGDVENHGTEEADDGASIEMELDDFYFGPTFVKTTPGATITLELHNEGSNPHTFTIDALGIDEEVAAGDTAEVEVTLPDDGATAFYCSFHKDSNGMQGAFFFNEGDPVKTSSPSGPSGSTPTTAGGGYGY